jgi:hypothetical protein
MICYLVAYIYIYIYTHPTFAILCTIWKFYSPFSLIAGVLQGPALCPLLCNIYINNLYFQTQHSNFF